MRVSVIIPTYNCGRWVVQAVESVLAQDFGDFELLVVDDGSTDETRDLLAGVNDARVRCFHKPNGGVSTARNLALDHAEGEYLAWLDADDLWPDDFLSTMVARLDAQGDYGAAYGSLTNIYPDGRPKELHRDRFRTSGQITADYFRWGFVSIITTVIRRAAVAGLRFDETLRTNSDTDLVLRLTSRVNFLSVPEARVTRRIRPDSLSRRPSDGLQRINKLHVLERFYFRLGGDAFVPRPIAMRTLARSCRGAAAEFLRRRAWRAARWMCRRALAYEPLAPGTCWDLGMTLLHSRRTDTLPDWQEPPPLPVPG